MDINKLADEIVLLAGFAEKCEQIGYNKAKEKYESQIEELQQDIAYYQEKLQSVRELVESMAKKYAPQCTHPYNGNMCLSTKPGETCPNCGCSGYND